jgi:hypothetical protein
MNSALSTANPPVMNAIARYIIVRLKSGGLLKGTVCSHSTDGSRKIVWIAIELPGMEARQVAIKCEQILKRGQEVVIECVPKPLKPGHYMFQMAGAPYSPAVG